MRTRLRGDINGWGYKRGMTVINIGIISVVWLARSKDLLLLRHALKFQKLRFRDSFKNAIKFFKKRFSRDFG